MVYYYTSAHYTALTAPFPWDCVLCGVYRCMYTSPQAMAS